MKSKQEIIKGIISIIEKVDDDQVLKDMKSLVNGVYKHYVAGEWKD